MKRVIWFIVVSMLFLAACQSAPDPTSQPTVVVPTSLPSPQPSPTEEPTDLPQPTATPDAYPAPVDAGVGAYPEPLDSLPSSAYPPPVPGDVKTILWEEAKALILDGQVAQVFQVHTRTVTLILKDGSTIQTTEPTLDEVLAIIQQCGEKCADIDIAIE